MQCCGVTLILPLTFKFLSGLYLVRESRCALSWCDLNLTFEPAVVSVTLTIKILPRLYLIICKV